MLFPDGGPECGRTNISNRFSVAKEGVLAAKIHNDPRIFRMAPRMKDCVHAVCDSSGDQLKPHAAGESR